MITLLHEYHCQTEESGLLALLQSEERPWLFVEGLGIAQLLALPEAASEFSPSWQHGRAFGATSELSWDKTNTGYTLRLFAPEPAGALPWIMVHQWTPIGDAVWTWLYGELDRDSAADAPIFVEARIPRRLRYPVSLDEAGHGVRVGLSQQTLQRDGLYHYSRSVAIGLLDAAGVPVEG